MDNYRPHAFKDKKTGKVLEYDKGEPNEPGYRALDHYHRPNPVRIERRHWYLDGAGRPKLLMESNNI